MKKKLKIQFLFWLAVLNISFIQSQTILQDYLEIEELRIHEADSINNLVKSFVNNNLPVYVLTQIEINEITNDLLYEHDGNTNPITGNGLDSIFKEVKKNKLFNIYFQQNPNNLTFFEPTPLPNTLKQECFNGDFVFGYASYTFREREVTPIGFTHLPNGCSINGNITNAYSPTLINSFNSKATIVSPGNEPYLASKNIFINRVPTGSIRALKLNPTPTSAANAQLGNQTSVSKNFIINESQINFSFLQFGHVINGSGTHYNPAFRYRLIDNVTGNILRQNCYTMDTNDCRYQQVSDNNWDGNSNNTLSYTPNWICEIIDTNDLIGIDARLEFLVSDCGYRGHFSTAYIANICGVTCSPTWGNLEIEQKDINCPTSNFDVCGNFTLPNGANLDSLTLNILDDTNNSIFQNSNPLVNGDSYCFSINLSDFGLNPSGNYTFEINLNNTSSCNQLSTITETNGNISFSDCINECDPITNISVNDHTLNWDDTGDCENNDPCYTLEFFSDGNCCEQPGSYFSATFTANTNSFNLWDVIISLQSKCFRYRIKTSCSNWSSWCCLAPTENGYILVEDCIPANECENYDDLINLTHPEDDVLIDETENHIEYFNIEATNIVKTGGISTYIANETITLSPGFHAEVNSSFHAYILPCASLSDQTSANRTSNNNKLDLNENLKVFPNPTNGKVIIESTKAILQWELISQLGSTVKKKTLTTNTAKKAELNLSSLPTGLYFIKITLNNGEQIIKRVIKK